MSHTDRFPRRHPLCTCPELTFANLGAVDRPACQGGTIAHPVLDAADVAALVAAARGEYRCICDPADVFEPPDPTPRAVEGCPAHTARRAYQRWAENQRTEVPDAG